MSPELLFQKICVAVLLLSMIPSFIWVWKDLRSEGLAMRLFMSSVGALIAPTGLAFVGLLVFILCDAITFIFS